MTCLLCLRYLTVTTVLGIIVLVVYMSGNKYVNKVTFFFKLKICHASQPYHPSLTLNSGLKTNFLSSILNNLSKAFLVGG